MKTNRAALFSALSSIGALANKRTTQPILNHFLIGAMQGKLAIRASDGESDATETIEADGVLEPVCVPALKLIELVRNGPEEIKLSLNEDRSRLICNYGNSQLPTLPASDFPPLVADEFKQIGVNPVDLASAISSVSWAVASFEQKIEWQCVHVKTDAKGIRTQALDGKTLAWTDKQAISGECEFMLIGASSGAFCDALERKGAELHLSSRRAMVKHENGSYAIKLPEGNYPASQADHVRKQCPDAIGKIDSAVLHQSLKTCKTLSDGLFPRIALMFNNSEYTVKLLESTSNFSPSTEGSFTTQAGFFFNADILIRALSALKSYPVLNLHCSNPVVALRIETPETQVIVIGLKG